MISLEDSVLNRRTLPYFFHRIRYFWVWFPVNQGVHILELLLLSSVLTQKHLLSFAFIQLFFEGILGFHWGALEVDRAWTRQNQNAELKTLHWDRVFSRAWIFSGLVAVSLITYALRDHSQMGLWTVHASYVLATAFRFFFEIPLQAWQSKIYSRSRIYRPLGYTLSTPIFHALSLWVGWEVFNLWAFAFAQIASGLFRITTGYFIYRRIEKAPQFRWAEVLQGLGFFPFKKGLLGLAQAATRMALPAVLIVSSFASESETWFRFSFLMVLAAPALKASTSWTQLFHYDLARLRDSSWGLIRRRFVTLGLIYGFLPTLFSCAVAVISISFVQPDLLEDGGRVLVLLLCLAQGVFAWAVTDAFTSRHPGKLLFSYALSFGIIAWIGSDPTVADLFWMVLISRMVPSLILFALRSTPRPEVLISRGPVSFGLFAQEAATRRAGKWLQWDPSWQIKTDVPSSKINAHLTRLLDRLWTKNRNGSYCVLATHEFDAERISLQLAGIAKNIQVLAAAPTGFDQFLNSQEEPGAVDFWISGHKELRDWIPDELDRRRIYRPLGSGLEARIRLKNQTLDAVTEDGLIVGFRFKASNASSAGGSKASSGDPDGYRAPGGDGLPR